MISLLTPTRNRPKSMKRLMNSIAKTTYMLTDIELIFRIDEDDAKSIAVAKKYSAKTDLNIKYVIKKRNRILSNLWNDCWEIAEGDIFMMCADDIIFKTSRWDYIVEEEFGNVPDRILFLWGKDGNKNDKLGTHGFIHRNWTDVTGYFVPPFFHYGHNDNWLTEIARNLERGKYNKDIFIEHLHWRSGKSTKDDVYKQQMSFKDVSKKIWNDTKKKRDKDIYKLKTFINVFAMAGKDV